jgi:hypothetical protein
MDSFGKPPDAFQRTQNLHAGAQRRIEESEMPPPL